MNKYNKLFESICKEDEHLQEAASVGTMLDTIMNFESDVTHMFDELDYGKLSKQDIAELYTAVKACSKILKKTKLFQTGVGSF